MANDPKKPETGKPAAAAPAPAKKGKPVVLMAVAAVVLVGGALGAWLALRHKPAQKVQAVAAVKAVEVVKAAPIYYKFDPAFVVNFNVGTNTRYLQVAIEAMSRDAKAVESMKDNDPAIRNDLLMLLSGQVFDSLMSVEGKEKLRQQALDAIRKTVSAEGVDGKLIEAAYFTSFVIQ